MDLTLELGTFNVLIGENGCGKSNILEALAFGAAACADKLDYEFLGSRGVRVTNPEFMYAAFENINENKQILISYKTDNEFFSNYTYPLTHDPANPRKWVNKSSERSYKLSVNQIAPILNENNAALRAAKANVLLKDNKVLIKRIESLRDTLLVVVNSDPQTYSIEKLIEVIGDMNIGLINTNPVISNFIIYAPEQSSLRKFEETNQIYPLGIKGEGLFQYLKDLGANEKNNELLKAIKSNLILLDWYEKFDLPESSLSNDFTLNIKDKYLNPQLQYFDQRSTNEGFLYLLFYSVLFLSDDTPAFFAIDNIDTSLNPKLCMQLIRSLVELAQKR
ncbi:AAA family ATPase [Paraflavitalea speifideaquila]|uniref:AAA family ATPase n=1 Tax=Paraflavitalea speifideaquila TaxID=3076558 RepID=UPI0028ECBE4F|nr:AAA family ATPase [Paraflavitalea speifideiaquila]